ncbi:hypothetical protein PN466_07160 [Roseofilum reptotaenium CS-1145]|uniref:Uncharacterized protein n=1 Tax=Roseofilum reptotaenium AO1-A TaxID=1925591 RepID=A0A1L9QJH6_9CYAN|nr:hypothetical protein [Roseofilum reptotaenium]MDB9516722.1 hypothetical protein [Roseofilum reptotaenium CS-1145]OJJ14165.1 hypothetical protein BI308_25170 [Roseofilum reptotaenium AO1-A]
MKTRPEWLNALLNFNQPLGEIVPHLRDFGWESDTALVVLNRQYLCSILQRYLHHQLSAEDLEDWANTIEGREDIAYDDEDEELLETVIFELANSLLASPLSVALIQDWLEKLNRSPIPNFEHV